MLNLGALCQPFINTGTSGFITRWTVSGDATARTVTLPLTQYADDSSTTLTYAGTVDWGDGTITAVSAYNDSGGAHTYATNGTYQIEIRGTCPGWSFDNGGDKLKLTGVIAWGSSGLFAGFANLWHGFYGCANLSSIGESAILQYSGHPITTMSACFYDCATLPYIPADILQNLTSVTTVDYCFGNCSAVTTIPETMFQYNTALAKFDNCFYQLTQVTSIPVNLFRYNTAAYSFQYCFDRLGITTIPVDLFRYNVNAGIFTACFDNCFSLTSIPAGMFQYNTLATSFRSCFAECSPSSVPADLFRYNTLVTDFGYCFYNAVNQTLATIPADLFRYNTLVTDFGYTFFGCILLTSLPSGIFQYNTSATNFNYCFQGCTALQVSANMFYVDGSGEATRFLNKSVNFTGCFDRVSFTGTQGTAPDLWTCSFGTGTPTTTGCFGSAGNNSTSLTNYASVPAGWK